MTNRVKYLVLNILALALCIAPPAITALYYFPLWTDATARVSGLAVLILIVCAIPFWRVLRDTFKNPSVKTIWFVGLLTFWLIRPIVDEMIVICAVGCIANWIGGLIFKWRDKYKENA